MEIRVKWDDLSTLIKKRVNNKKKISRVLRLFKCEIKKYDVKEAEILVPIERIDLFSVEGISRILKSYLKGEVIVEIKQQKSNIRINVTHEAMKNRPYISCAVIEGVSLSREALKQIRQFQEKVHSTYCRGKRKASIFVHDLDKIVSPITFTCKKPEEIEFTPLGENKVMKAKEILTETSIGKLCRHLFFALEKYPIIVDSEGKVLSMPMAISSEETRIDEKTNRLLIISSGVEKGLIDNIVSVMIANMLERGGKLKSTLILYPHMEITAPLLRKKIIEMNLEWVGRILNVHLTTEKVKELLVKAGYKVEMVNGNNIKASVPFYRFDVVHVNDVIEDLLLLYGIEKIRGSRLQINEIVFKDRLTRFIGKVKKHMIGFGYQEIMSQSLIDEEMLMEFIDMDEELIRVLNVISPHHSVLRSWLLPGILDFLSSNVDKMYPQKIFEIGYITRFSEKRDTKSINILKIAAAISDFKVSYEKIATPVYLMLRRTNIPFKFEPTSHKAFIEGRTARVIIGKGQNKKEIGIIGEVHPKVLMKFKILNPVTAFELNLQKLFEYIVRTYDGAAEI